MKTQLSSAAELIIERRTTLLWELYKMHLELQLTEVREGSKEEDEVCPNCALENAAGVLSAWESNRDDMLSLVEDSIWINKE